MANTQTHLINMSCGVSNSAVIDELTPTQSNSISDQTGDTIRHVTCTSEIKIKYKQILQMSTGKRVVRSKNKDTQTKGEKAIVFQQNANGKKRDK